MSDYKHEQMRVSLLIEKLQDVLAKHGDLVVCQFGWEYIEPDDVHVIEDTADCPEDYSPPQMYWDGHEKVVMVG